MRKKILIVHHLVVWGLTLLMAIPPGVLAQQPQAAPVFKQEELDQVTSADRALSRFIGFADIDGFDVSARSGPGRPIRQTERKPQRRRVDQGAGIAKLGSECQVAGQFPSGADDDERKTRMDPETGRRFPSAAKSVMDTIQGLRAKAQAAGNLKTTKEQTSSSKKRSSRSSPPVRRWSTCRLTIPRWCTVPGPILRPRRTTIIRPDM